MVLENQQQQQLPCERNEHQLKKKPLPGVYREEEHGDGGLRDAAAATAGGAGPRGLLKEDGFFKTISAGQQGDRRHFRLLPKPEACQKLGSDVI